MNSLGKVPLGIRILAGLLLGVCVGVLLPPPGAVAWSDNAVEVGRIAGQLWLSALQMTVLPLVFALLVTGLGRPSGKNASSGSLARRVLSVFALLYFLSLIVAIALNRVLLHVWPVSADAIAAFEKLKAGSVAAAVPSASEVVLSLVPSNVFAAFAAGSILPVVVFAILFGLAMRQIEDRGRERIAALVESIGDVLFRIVATCAIS